MDAAEIFKEITGKVVTVAPIALPDPLTPEELAALAREALFGNVFFSTQVDSLATLPMVFMPLAFAGKALETLGDDLKRLVLYGRMEDAGERSINGYPMFMSCYMLLIEDYNRIVGLVDKAKEAIEAVLAGE